MGRTIMNHSLLGAALAAASMMAFASAHAESFTYHGTLQDAGKPAEGAYDLQLTLYSSAHGGPAKAPPVMLYGVEAHEGSFSTTADFATVTRPGSQSWLEVAVKPAGAGTFATLDGRSPVSPDTNSCPGAWSLDGNSGNPGGSYIGTADAKDVLLKAGGSTLVGLIASTKAVGIAAGAVGGSSGTFSTAISDANLALGAYSFAGGYSGGTLNDGSFVWGDFPTATHFINDSGPNQFIVQANGGVGINTAHSEGGTAPLDATMTLALPSDASGSALASLKFKGGDAGTTSVRLGGISSLVGTGQPVFAIASHNADGTNYQNATFAHNHTYFNAYSSGTSHALAVGSDGTDGNGAYLTPGGAWTSTSSRTLKEDFAAVNVESVLTKLVAMPVQTWFYKQSHAEGVHMGPIAEDFAAMFGLGADDRHIVSVDESGVAFAAIQGLNKKVESENTKLKQENADLRGKYDDLATRLARLERGKGE